MSDSVEDMIQQKGLTAPRVTPDDVEANILHETTFVVWDVTHDVSGVPAEDFTAEDGFIVDTALGLLTICVLVLRNGYTVTGISACASKDNFDAEIGASIARRNAVNQIWPLMGYELRTKLAAV